MPRRVDLSQPVHPEQRRTHRAPDQATAQAGVGRSGPPRRLRERSGPSMHIDPVRHLENGERDSARRRAPRHPRPSAGAMTFAARPARSSARGPGDGSSKRISPGAPSSARRSPPSASRRPTGSRSRGPCRYSSAEKISNSTSASLQGRKRLRLAAEREIALRTFRLGKDPAIVGHPADRPPARSGASACG